MLSIIRIQFCKDLRERVILVILIGSSLSMPPQRETRLSSALSRSASLFVLLPRAIAVRTHVM
jgi:hypothetical protein